ncbi:MAG TPA: outer membrane protein transport protein [Acidobacteriaceae bacterium]|nr:outer membrane protein transport protein [Acidobacteriaceae bacterium]
MPNHNSLPYRLTLRAIILCGLLSATSISASAQATSFGNGLSAAAESRGGTLATQQGSPLDAVEGNPAGLAGIKMRTLEAGAVGIFGSGSFQNSVNSNGRMSGTVGAMPFGAFVTPIRASHWAASAAFTPEILMRANWSYVDAPGTAGVTYGLQTNETQIIAVRSSLGVARTLGSKWSAGAVLGLVYNTNNLNAPYIFQQQPQLAGLKVLLNLQTHGIGWNGNAGVQWQPNHRTRIGLAWKSGTTIHTNGDASGTASALFTALGLTADPTFHYQVQVLNHLPQAFDAGLSLQSSRHLVWQAQGDFTAWGQAFQQLPVSLSQGTNTTINSVVGSSSMQDSVPLQWNNQFGLHFGVNSPFGESWAVRAGYSFMSNPVPSATLLPLTAAIMQNSIATGAGWTHSRLHLDAAYQVQLPSSESVGKSSILAGEYSNSRVRLMLQSVTCTARVNF